MRIKFNELKRLAEIGKATEKAFNTSYGSSQETVIVVSGHTEDGGWIGYEALKNVDELLKWSKEN